MDSKALNKRAAIKIMALLKEDERSMAWMSRRVEIPYPTLKRMMKGEARVTMGALADIALALDVPVAELLDIGDAQSDGAQSDGTDPRGSSL